MNSNGSGKPTVTSPSADREGGGVILRLNPKPKKSPYGTDSQPSVPQTIEITAEAIIDAVIRHYRVARRDLLSPLKVRRVVRARHVAMYLIREFLDLSLKDIGATLGGRDHTTVIYGLRRIAKKIQSDSNLASDLDSLRNQLAGGETFEQAE
jgi:hypothetical protein